MNTMSGVLYLQSSEQVQANCILKLGHLFFFPAMPSQLSLAIRLQVSKPRLCIKTLLLVVFCGVEGQKGPSLTKAKSDSFLAHDGLTLLQILLDGFSKHHCHLRGLRFVSRTHLVTTPHSEPH